MHYFIGFVQVAGFCAAGWVWHFPTHGTATVGRNGSGLRAVFSTLLLCWPEYPETHNPIYRLSL